MKFRFHGALCALAAIIAFVPTNCPAAVEIQFWHSMTGKAADSVVKLADRFNALYPRYRLIPVYKGQYGESMVSGVAALRNANAPQIVQIPEEWTADVLAEKGAFKPLYALMNETGEKFDSTAFLGSIPADYKDSRGRMLAMPFDKVIPVLYYNKSALRKAGLDPETPLKTWQDVQRAAIRLRDSDATPCSFTTGWQSWVQIETLSARHNEPFATRNNGYDGLDARLLLNTALFVRHVALLSSWAKSGLFTYAGRRDEAESRFSGGECGLLTSSSASYSRIAGNAAFELGVSALPYYDDYRGAPYDPPPGGEGLWTTAGRSAAEYSGVAKFFVFLSRPDVQAEWRKAGGYLPVSGAGLERSRSQAHKGKKPGARISGTDRHGETFARGPRLGNFEQIRAVINEELEAVWNRTKTPKEALDIAVERGNGILRRFERAANR